MKSSGVNSLGKLIFFFSPLIAFPLFLWNIFNERKGNLIYLSVCMSLVAIITPPFADLYRHTLMYLEFLNLNNTEQILYTNDHDFVLYTLSHAFAVLGIPFELIRGLFVFISYQISFFLYKRVIIINQYVVRNKKVKFFVFLIFFLSVPFIWIVNGLRMATACYVAALGWYFCYNKRFIYGFILYMLSLGIHFGCLMFLPIMLCTIKPLFTIKKYQFIIIAILIVSSGSLLLKLLPHSLILSLGVEKDVNSYMVNSVERFDEVMSIHGLIAMYLERLPLILILISLFKGSLKLIPKDLYLIQVCYIIIFLVLPFTILFQKICLFVTPLILFLVLKNSNNRSQILKLLIMCIGMTGAYMYGYRAPLLCTPFYELLVSPIYTIFNIDTLENIHKAIIPV